MAIKVIDKVKLDDISKQHLYKEVTTFLNTPKTVFAFESFHNLSDSLSPKIKQIIDNVFVKSIKTHFTRSEYLSSLNWLRRNELSYFCSIGL